MEKYLLGFTDFVVASVMFAGLSDCFVDILVTVLTRWSVKTGNSIIKLSKSEKPVTI